MPRRLSSSAVSAAAVSVWTVLAGSSVARAVLVPDFAFAQSSVDHAISSADAPDSAGIAMVDGTAALTYSDTQTFASGSGGKTIAKAGLARRADAGAVRITFASGTGVSQVDPGHVKGPSTLQINFEARWTITAGTFGPPVLTSFSVPIGLNVGAGGAAGFSVAVRWDATVGGTTIADAREPFISNVPFGPGKYLTSVAAPARPFAFTSLTGTSGQPATIRMYGNIVFAVDNEDAPSMIEFPTSEDFGDLPDFAQYNFEPGLTTEEPVPEPATAGLLGAGAVSLLAARRRRDRKTRTVRAG